MSRPKPTWRTEFSESFAVPPDLEALVAAGELADLSWHNDTCPSFGWVSEREDAEDLRIWVDHPDEREREHVSDQVGRFATTWIRSSAIQAEFCTNEVERAIAKYREWLPLVKAATGVHPANWLTYRVRLLLRAREARDAQRLADAHRSVDHYLRDSDARLVESDSGGEVATILFEALVDAPERLHVELSGIAGDVQLFSQWLLLDRAWDRAIGDGSVPWPDWPPTDRTR